MPEDALPASLQESLLALLAFNDKFGTAVAAQVTPNHFDAPYQEIATKLLSYRREYGRAPTRAHLDDIFAKELSKTDSRTRKLLIGLNTLDNVGFNAEYVANRVQHHIRRQTLKSAIMRAGEFYQSGGDENVEQVEQVLYAALRTRHVGLTPGIRLSEASKLLSFLDHKDPDFTLGIPTLDKIGFGVSAKELLLYIAPKSSGKTWFGIHMGRIGIQHRAKVLHLSLEWPQERILGRYCQSLFGVGSRGDAYARTAFEYDDLKKLAGWETKRQRPRLNFNSPDIRKFFQEKFKQWGARFGTLIIKDFPSGSLTITQLNAYLDYLEQFERFIPTLVIVDYPDLMKQDARDLRVSIGRTVVDLRGMASERNFALICPTQGGRSSIGAKHVKSKDIAEDISKVWTADSVLTYSRTEAEEARGLARLSVQHARNTVGGHEVVISQAYSIGQYVLDSALMSKAYWDQMKGEDDDSAES